MNEDHNPFEDSDFEFALERHRRLRDYETSENKYIRQSTDTEVAEQEEQRRAALAADRRDRLWFLTEDAPRIDSLMDKDRRGREEGVR